jgi:hypothetical protein
MMSWTETKTLVLCSGYNVLTLSQKEIFSLQGAWHSLITLPTVVHGQAFRTITRQTRI